MFGQNATSDKELLKMVNRRLQRSGSQAGVVATVNNGSVTITGKLRTEDQRLTIVRALRGVNGVRQVIDQLQSPPKKQPQRYQPPSPTPAATPSVETDGCGPPLPAPAAQEFARIVLPVTIEGSAAAAGDILPSVQ